MHRIHPALTRSDTPLRVALVGVGGTGSELLSGLLSIHRDLLALGRAGLQVSAFDPDEVSSANLVRQRFSDADLGRNKAQVLIGRINAHARTDWTAAPQAFRGALSTQSWDLVISCVDTRKSRAQIHRSAFTQKAQWLGWLDCGNEANYGQVIYGEPGSRTTPGHTSTVQNTRLRCATEIHPDIMDTTRPESSVPSCSAVEALAKQDLFVNGVAAKLGLMLLWQALGTGKLAHQGYYFDLASGQAVALQVPPPHTPAIQPTATKAAAVSLPTSSPRKPPRTPPASTTRRPGGRHAPQ